MKKVPIKVDEDVRKRLRDLKSRFGLDFNDIISMGLAFMEQKETKIFIDADIAQVTVNIKKAHLDSLLAKTLIEKGYDIFIPKIDARQAHYIKRKLKAELGIEIIIHPVTVSKQDGYLLMATRKPSS